MLDGASPVRLGLAGPVIRHEKRLRLTSGTGRPASLLWLIA